MSKKMWLAILAYGLLCNQMSYAQSIGGMTLSIEKLFELADQNSRSILSSQKSNEISEMAIRIAKAEKLPDLNTSVAFSYLGNGCILDRDFSNGAKASIPH